MFHTKIFTDIYQSFDYVDSSISGTNITLCAINVCGLNSKLKYKTLQEYINNIDIICLTETKCNKIEENEIKGYKSFVMHRKSTQHKYGGIQGICIFVKERIALNCVMLCDFISESILWLYVNDKVMGYDFILGAVYLPHEMSVHYHYDIFDQLSDDIITIRAKYNVSIMLLGDFNSRVGLKSDFEVYYEHDNFFFIEGLIIPIFYEIKSI